MLCSRYLATGESFQSLSYQFRVGTSTISKIVTEVCDAIWVTMKGRYMAIPNTSQEWQEVADNFFARWDFPNCIGSIDGKHIVITCPPNTGSMHYNYKGTFSIVLMAMADANYNFIYVHIGSYGRNSDAGIFANSALGYSLSHPEVLGFPADSPIRGRGEFGPLPFVAVADEAFPLQRHLMRPYPSRAASAGHDAFNYRHSRARRIVECTFGILATRWRVFHSKIAVSAENVTRVVQAACVLHNMLQRDSTPAMTDEMIRVQHAEAAEVRGLKALPGFGTRGTNEAIAIREVFRDYFVKHPLLWQEAYLRAKSGK